MVISLKDGLKLVGVAVTCLCAAFVCTFMLNFYVDAHSIESAVTESTEALYKAQLATAQFTSAITGGVLLLTSAATLIFYVKLYVDSHIKDLGVLKAMGYSERRLALSFWVFALSAFAGIAPGIACGFAAMPTVYKGLSIEGLPKTEITFHPEITITMLFVPPLIFAAVACVYAYMALKKPVTVMLKGTSVSRFKPKREREYKTFLAAMCFGTLKSKRSLAFFIAFSCFCFSAMVQMGASMESLTSATMGYMILAIGLILAVTIITMAIASLVHSNKKNVAVMKAFGYSAREIAVSVFLCYVPFALLGFGLGTVYQYGLLNIMINIVFKDVAEVPEYAFNVPVFFITFAAFILFYGFMNAIFTVKLIKTPTKVIMEES